LVRGGVELGIVTHDMYEDAGAWDVGYLAPSPAFESVRPLFEREQQVFDQLLAAELAPSGADPSESARLRLEAELVQGEILTPGVQMVRLDDVNVYRVDELHLEGAKVYWR
jgi:hypothetical protein